MGGATSVERTAKIEEADGMINIMCAAPVDASDVHSEKDAFDEIIRLRKAMVTISEAREDLAFQLSPRSKREAKGDPSAGSTRELEGGGVVMTPFKMQGFNEPGELTCVMIPPTSKKSIVFVGGESGLIRSYDYRKGHVVKTFAGHKRAVTAIAAGGGTEEKYFVSASKDKSVRVWRTDTPEAVATLRGHSQTVTSVAVFDVSLIATGCDDGKLRIFNYDPDEGASNMTSMVNFAEDADAGGGKAAKKKGKKSPRATAAVAEATPDRSSQVLSVAISSSLIAAGRSALSVAVLNHAGVVLCEIPHEGWIYSCAFTRAGTGLITGSSDGATRVFAVESLVAAAPTAKCRPSPPPTLPTESCFQGANRSWVMDVAADNDLKFFCCAQHDGDVAVWKTPATEPGRPFYATDPSQILRSTENGEDQPEPNAVAINWNGSLVCCPYSDGFLRIYKLGAAPKPKAAPQEMTDIEVASLKLQKISRGKNARKHSLMGQHLPCMRPPEKKTMDVIESAMASA